MVTIKSRFSSYVVGIMLMVMTCIGQLNAQNVRRVQGTLLASEDGLPIIGASVVIEGTQQGVVTDLNGNFEIPNVPASAKNVRFSYVGMQTKILPIKPNMKVYLEAEAELVDEVVVVAYGTAKKSTFTGSAAVVNAEKLDQRPVTEATSALLGAVPGVSINTTSGMPGESSTIRVRGNGSVNGSSDPLIILDGVPYDGAMSSLNPSDIASITVLKDAASAALYGSRAANGVIMITSKTGREGKATVSIKLNQGFTKRGASDYKRLSPEQYLEIYWEMLRNNAMKGGVDAAQAAQTASANLMTAVEYNPYTNVSADAVVGTDGRFNKAAVSAWSDDTDWEDAIQQTGNRTDMSVAVNGGSNKSDYYFSAGYTTEEGYIVGSKFDRFSAKANINSQVKSWLKAGLTASANLSSVNGTPSESRGTPSNVFLFSRYISPLYPIHMHDAATGQYILDASGNKVYDFGTGYSQGALSSPVRSYGNPYNPAIEMRERENRGDRKMFNVKAYATATLCKDLTLTANANVMSNSYLYGSAEKVYAEKGNSGSASRTNTFTTTYTYNQLLEWKPTFGQHNVDVLFGHESYSYEYNYLHAAMSGQIMEGNNELVNYTDASALPSSYTNTYRTEGYFSRVTYDYDGRYYASLSYRRDGSSRFHKDSRWGDFYSVGAGWTLSRESFLKDVRWIDNLKLRMSYGEVGNDDVGAGYYPWVASYTGANNGSQAGFVQSSLGNKNLQWEVSHNFDAGIEFALWHRLSGTVEFYNRQSSNMLFEVPLSPSAGFESQSMNAGEMYNRGIEFQLNARLYDDKKWNWSVNVNGSTLNNKITSLPISAFMLNDVSKVEEGHSLYEFYVRDYRGVDPATGNALYTPTAEALESGANIVEVEGQKFTTALAEADYHYAGQGSPTFTGGFGTTLGWQGLTLDVKFYYQLGGKCYDIAMYNLMRPNQRSYNTLSTEILDRWQQAGDVTCVPRLADASEVDLYGEFSNRWIISSNMLELATATLSYALPSRIVKPWGINGLSVYCSGDNLFQLTKRQGIYPRQHTSGYSNNAETYAPARSFTFGLNLTF